mmetsp:Transcript_24279/g.56378  ORF Transcript_24279/g.56378 Transcript_24279/m.56378 type:complete len:84 (+) Transcript_24279:41-292(+)
MPCVSCWRCTTTAPTLFKHYISTSDDTEVVFTAGKQPEQILLLMQHLVPEAKDCRVDRTCFHEVAQSLTGRTRSLDRQPVNWS